MPVDTTTFERHYRISELARMWGLGRETLRVMVKDEPGLGISTSLGLSSKASFRFW
jgi:hypothetical protein